MKTCKEMAKLWGVTERTVTTFCKTGKIPGAVKEGKSWRIPDEAEKPVDGRILSGKYVKFTYFPRSEERRVGKECRSRW